MAIFELLQEMQQRLATEDLSAVEDRYRRICEELSGAEAADAIISLDLTAYRSQLREMLQAALQAAQGDSARALYFEYDMDNAWDGACFVCPEYNAPEIGDDDWAAEWTSCIEGPSQADLARLYQSDFASTMRSIGINLYLIARTVVTFAEARRSLNTTMPVCIGFHDQERVVRT